MILENIVNTGLSGIKVEFTLAELIVLKNTIEALPKKQTGIKYSDIKEQELKACDNLRNLISRITNDIQSLNEAAGTLFAPLPEEPEQAYPNETCYE